MPPQYIPLGSQVNTQGGAGLTQQQLFQILQSINRAPQQQGPLTYEQWLIATGRASPQQVPQQGGGINAGSVVDALGGKKAGDALEGLFSSSKPDTKLISDYVTGGAGKTAIGNLGTAGGTTFANGGTYAGTAVGTAADGGTIMSTGAVVPASEGIPVASTGAELAPAGGAFDFSGIGAEGNAILPVAGAIGAYDLFANQRTGARGALQGAASGAAMGSYFGPWGAAIGGGVGLGAGLANSLFHHESTRDVANKHNKELAGVATDDPVYQAYVRGMRSQFGHEGGSPDPEHPFAGKYKTWDEYKKAGLDPTNLTGVYGNLKTFGPEWTKLNFAQQVAATKALIDANLYDSKKGEVIITDPERARQVFQSVQQGGFKAPAVMPSGANIDPGFTNPNLPAKTTLANMPAVVNGQIMIPRSKTVSPGISKSGQRIRY